MQKVNIQPGQFVWSMQGIADRFGISKAKVYRMVKLLEDEKIVKHKGYSKYSLFTILNRHLYQDKGNADDTANDTTNETQAIRKQEGIKNEKEGKEKNIPPDFSEIVDYCKSRGNEVDPEKRYNFYASKGRMVGKNKMVDWRAAVRTREKKKDIDEIFQEYKKSQEDITPETKPIVWKSFIDKYGKDKMQKVLDKVNEGIGTFITNL